MKKFYIINAAVIFLLTVSSGFKLQAQSRVSGNVNDNTGKPLQSDTKRKEFNSGSLCFLIRFVVEKFALS